MTEFHNSSSPLLWQRYADTLIYQSLNEYLKGNRTAAEYYFKQAYQMTQKEEPQDITKAKKILNWQPQVTLETGLKTTVKWFQQNKKQP